MANTALSIDEFRSGPVCVVALGGRIDSTNAEQLMTRLQDLLSSEKTGVLVDLGRVHYLTSAAFRALLVATRDAERKPVPFALCSISGLVRELFEMACLLEAFSIYSSREEALAKLT